MLNLQCNDKLHKNFLYGEFNIKDISGKQLKGTFKYYENNIPHDGMSSYMFTNGEILHPNGKLESGEFYDNKLLKGYVIYPNDNMFEGEFKNGFLIKGKKLYNDDTIINGIFDNNSRLIKGCRLDKYGNYYDVECDKRCVNFENKDYIYYGMKRLNDSETTYGYFDKNFNDLSIEYVESYFK